MTPRCKKILGHLTSLPLQGRLGGAFKILILILLTHTPSRASRVDTLDVYSPSMQKNSRCVIITPDAYTLTGQPYPVLYLLHGWSGNYVDWLNDAPQLALMADRYQLLIVCPDGGYDSWYLDSPVDSTMRYDTHVSREVVSFVDQHYHTRRDRGGRAIAGLSMGGHGAITLAAKHPDVYGAAGSMCGGLDLRPFKINRWNLKRVVGNPLTHWKNWEAASAVNMADRFKNANVQLIIDCGVGDFFIETNRDMHQKLLAANVPHEYTERPGEHTPEYWTNAIDFQVVFFDKFFRASKPR
jgi:S-formylglutathione hydrolase FrmB